MALLSRSSIIGLGLVVAGCSSRLITDLEAEGDSVDTTSGEPTAGPGTTPQPTSPQPDTGVPPPACGNGLVDPGEACDGFDLAGQSCESLALGTGELTCLPDCGGVDPSGCGGCGNGLVEPGEVCDGFDLAGQTCISQGFDRGNLRCDLDCDGFDISQCNSVACGNGVVEDAELCDGLDLGGASCLALGLADGLLACQDGCMAFDAAGCGANCIETDLGEGVGPGIALGSTVEDDDDLSIDCAGSGGQDHVMSYTGSVPGAYVFDTVGSSYDTALAAFASCSQASQLVCNDDAGGELTSQIVVPLGTGQTILVVVDGFSGDVGDWVLNVGPPSVPPLPACVEQDLLWSVGSPVAGGDTDLEDEDLAQGCADGGAVDYVMRFIAPLAGTYVFDTAGSSYDTALSAYLGCDAGSEIACNDDVGKTLQSQIVLDLGLGESILVVVSGWGGQTGDWVLNIAKQ